MVGTNEIMTAFSDINKFWTLATAEIIEHIFPVFQIDKNYLPNNDYYENIENKQDFFDYKCSDDLHSKYDAFCSELDMKNNI